MIFIFYILVILGCGGNSSQKGELDFTLTGIDGKIYVLSEQKGKIVLVNFWATWCPPCKMEIPILIKIYEKYKDKKFLILSVGLDKNELLEEFAEKYKINYPVLIGTKDIAKKYKISAIPQSYLLDKKGKVVKKWLGLSPNFEEELESKIDSLL